MPRASPTYPGLLHPGAENVYFASVVKLRRPAILVALMCALACVPLRAEVELSGYLKTGEQTKVILRDPAADKTSSWLNIGDTFQGYTIMGFDPAHETVALEKSGEQRHVGMKPGVVVGYDPVMAAQQAKQQAQAKAGAVAEWNAYRAARSAERRALNDAMRQLHKSKGEFLKRKAREDAVKYAKLPETRSARAQMFAAFSERWVRLKEEQMLLERNSYVGKAQRMDQLKSELAQLERWMAE